MSSPRVTHALILAAGRGERMRPLTDATPKPLLQAGGKRLIEWQIESLVRAGVREIVVNVAHLPDQFDSALGDGRRYGAALRYSREGGSADDALESLGGIVKALPWLGHSPFVVTSGDIVTDYPYHLLHASSEAQQQGDADAHLVLVENPPFHLRGDMGLTNQRIDPDATPRMTYANIGVFSPRLFTGVANMLQGRRAPLFPWLYAAARAGRVSGEVYRGSWWNAGTPDDLAQVDADLTRVANQAASGEVRR
ncbi:MAG: N-acetylmuramate alpha-1-phosphate uridylyltransferase MurU [Burkholderiaceae bacterium]